MKKLILILSLALLFSCEKQITEVERKVVTGTLIVTNEMFSGYFIILTEDARNIVVGKIWFPIHKTKTFELEANSYRMGLSDKRIEYYSSKTTIYAGQVTERTITW